MNFYSFVNFTVHGSTVLKMDAIYIKRTKADTGEFNRIMLPKKMHYWQEMKGLVSI